jgi:hypothetical protein
MLAYFPLIYPDELVYSVVARWLRHQGCERRTIGLERLFGRRFAMASIHVPSGLSVFQLHFPNRLDLGPEHLLDAHTLFPYFSAFEPPVRRAQMRAAIQRGRTQGIYVQSGLAAYRIPPVRTLRFCADCLREMQANHGETYWRRAHQLPGVLLCVSHGRPLQVSRVTQALRGRHEFVPATSGECPDNARYLWRGKSSVAVDRLTDLARRSVDLLEHPLEAKTLTAWAGDYRFQLQHVGLTHSLRRVNQRALDAAFRQHVQPILAALPELVAGQNWRGDWLAGMTRSPRRAAHPLQHLLLRQFLDSRSAVTDGFGQGPWRCFNPIADHQGEVTIATMRTGRNHGRIFGEFTCTCGYSYTRRLGDNGMPEAPRLRTFGPLLIPELRRLIAAKMSLHSIADRLRLDATTVVRSAHENGLPVAWLPRARRPLTPRSPMPRPRTSDPPAHKPQRTSRTKRRDWALEDEIELRHVEVAARSLLGQLPPVRLTIASIERELGRREWLTQRELKLPHASARLRELVESTAAFEARRIRWAVNQMVNGHPPRDWEVMRLAGVRSTALPFIRSLLDPGAPARRDP